MRPLKQLRARRAVLGLEQLAQARRFLGVVRQFLVDRLRDVVKVLADGLQAGRQVREHKKLHQVVRGAFHFGPFRSASFTRWSRCLKYSTSRSRAEARASVLYGPPRLRPLCETT